MALTNETLEAILAAEGWPFERLDATTWRSGFQAPGPRRIRFSLRLTPDWLFLTIILFAVEQRDIVLTVELPTQELTQSQIRDGLDALSVYA